MTLCNKNILPDKTSSYDSANLTMCGGHRYGHISETCYQDSDSRHPLHTEAHGAGHPPGHTGAHHLNNSSTIQYQP